MTLNYFCLLYRFDFLLYRFDLEIEHWGVDINELKEIAISRSFVGWTEDWEKEKRKVDGAVNKVLLANKYKDICFVLPDTGLMYYIQEEDVVNRRRYGWVMYAQCNVPGVEAVPAVTLIQKTDQVAGIQFLHPEPGSQRDKVWDPNDPDG